MRQHFSDPDAGEDPYFKVDKALPLEQLSALEETICPFEAGAMLRSGVRIARFYQEIAVPLAQAHDIEYPQALERILILRLEDLQNSIR